MRMFLFIACVALACAQPGPPLRLEKTIPLPGVQGRIDHLSIDVNNQRLFVAALGNDTLEVVDLKQRKRVHTIPGLREPQGILYVPGTNRLYVANGKDGTVRIYDGSSYALQKTIEFGDDADNLQYDAAQERVYVGYGSGSLGVIDKAGNKITDIKLGSHPESFQLEKSGSKIFVNLPKSRKIAVVDRVSGSVTASWGTGGAFSNYPMSLDEANHRLFVVCRLPARLLVIDTNTGKIVAKMPAAGDCDDVFYDAGRQRIYATGGEGVISVFQQRDPDQYSEIAKIPTVKGARTSFFSSDLGRLFVAVRRNGAEEAAIRVYVAAN